MAYCRRYTSKTAFARACRLDIIKTPDWANHGYTLNEAVTYGTGLNGRPLKVNLYPNWFFCRAVPIEIYSQNYFLEVFYARCVLYHRKASPQRKEDRPNQKRESARDSGVLTLCIPSGRRGPGYSHPCGFVYLVLSVIRETTSSRSSYGSLGLSATFHQKVGTRFGVPLRIESRRNICRGSC